MKQLNDYEGQHCANCGTAMQGEFCHECGQSIHSVIKPIHGMLEDTMDIVFHVDGRVVHTIPPLLLKPGFLTLEYFSGRRVRYIAPFRLMFVLSLLAFFVIHLRLDAISEKIDVRNHAVVATTSDEFEDAKSPRQVRAVLNQQLDDLDEARKSDVIPQAVLPEMDIAAQKIRDRANQRLIALGEAPMPAASLATPAVAATSSDGTGAGIDSPTHDAQGKASDEPTKPIQISWLPDMVNARLTLMVKHAQANWHVFKHGNAAARDEAKQHMIGGFFGVLPPTMFVLMPIFALLLKLLYLFKRRLYVEHLIVALHSHAFLFLNLLIGVLVSMLSTWVKPHAAWLAIPLEWIALALWLWAPIYLLIMQKRVYRQGWPMTVLKYLLIGWCYCWLLMFALIVAFVLGLAH